MMLAEVHEKLCRTTKLDLGPEIHVEELRKEHVLQRAREQEKVPAVAMGTKMDPAMLIYLLVMLRNKSSKNTRDPFRISLGDTSMIV